MLETPIILASASPRRSELLREIGVPFEVITSGVTEFDSGSAPHLVPITLARENAWHKATAVATEHPGRWVLGADTVVALNERVFGKPMSLDQARYFLMELSGQIHEVITGCALIDPEGGEEIFHQISYVTFQIFGRETADRYLANVNVLDKAGGYALQEHGDWIVESVEGSRNNVIGLPTERLIKVFKRRGLFL